MEDKGIIHAEKIGPTMGASGPPYSRTGNQRVEAEALVVQQGVDLFNQELTGDLHCPLRTAGGHGAPAMMEGSIVRRLTPLECERLQGFPDDYSKIPWNGKPTDECPDSHRYKALGNSMAVPVMRWLGERIDMMHSADLSNRSKPKARKQMTLW